MPVFQLKPHNTFAIEASASNANRIDKLEQLTQFVGCHEHVVLGGGSNILLLRNIEVPVLKMELKGIQIREQADDYLVEAMAGEDWHQLVKMLTLKGIGGLENLALIPGTVGASPIQNIGAYGVELADVVETVDYFDLSDGKQRTLAKDECAFGYRDSIFKHRLKGKVIITKVTFRLSKRWTPDTRYGALAEEAGSTPAPIDVFNAVCRIRSAKLPDPTDMGNAGSFFKNPVVDAPKVNQLKCEFPNLVSYQVNDSDYKIAAGWLIDQCGLKGEHVGGAYVHDKQALVLVNKGGASSADVLKLSEYVRQKVKTKFGVDIEPEVRFIGPRGELNYTEALDFADIH